MESPHTNTNKPLRIGTRGSKLARWQADWVAAELSRLGTSVEIVEISTQGDREQAGPLSSLGGEGVFTKEIQRALLANEVDLAVHSLKDLPTEPVAGLVLGAVPTRASTADALVSNAFASLDELPQGARIGTGSPRRQAQLLHRRPDLQVLGIRGNVDTRLRKLDDGEYNAIILAEAGLQRLGLADRIAQSLTPDIMLPAVGQGALGIECRDDDPITKTALQNLDDQASRFAVEGGASIAGICRGRVFGAVGSPCSANCKRTVAPTGGRTQYRWSNADF